MNEQHFNEAFAEAFTGMRRNDGGPFGSVVVLNGEVIGRGHNCVTSVNDPTAHAEVMAIRDACKNIGSFELTGAVLYATCEPCPMCMAAIYWARIDTLYYSSTRYDAAAIGFDDNLIYQELARPNDEKLINIQHVVVPQSKQLFDEWSAKPDKLPY